MRLTPIQIITLAAMLLTGACSGAEGQEALVAENARLGTQIVELRTTATFQADQLKQTEEYIQTVVPKANRLRDELASTLAAVGIDVTLHPVEANSDFKLATAPAVTSNNTFQQPSIIVEGTVMPSLPAPDGGVVVSSAGQTPTVGQPSLFNLIMTDAVGANDCALASVTAFKADTLQIYVVATAANIPAGTLLGAQWYLGDTLLTKQEFAPKNDVHDNCIWFYVEPVDFPFAAGDYRVDLLINGTPVSGAQASFSIQDTGAASGG